MWAHQYLQAVNEINAIKADPHVWTHDGDLAETYGLEPNYGCCTANFNQGWPKFSLLLVFSTPPKINGDGSGVNGVSDEEGDGIVIGVWAPVSVSLLGASVNIDTDYPFGDTVIVTVMETSGKQRPLSVRIPSWADEATVNGVKVQNGTMYLVPDGAAGGTTTKVMVDFHPLIRVEEWFNGAVSVHRGGTFIR